MSQNFSRRLRFISYFILLPLIVAKLLWSLSLFFLDKGTVQTLSAENYGYHYTPSVAQKMIGGLGISTANQTVNKDDDGEELKNMKLKGTYLGGDASFMIIEDTGKSEFVYIGEKYKGYELVRVSEQKVGLTKHGKNYFILLWDDKGKGKQTPQRLSKISPPATPASPGMPASISKNELQTYIKDPNKIWKNIRIQEQRENGQINGFRVNYVKKSSFFDVAGLRSGDVIKGIDGNVITSLADVMKYYTNVDSLDSLTLTVERASEEIELDFNVN